MHVMAFDIADGVVQTIRSIINPDKLGHLGPLADVRAMLHDLKAERQASARPAKRGMTARRGGFAGPDSARDQKRLEHPDAVLFDVPTEARRLGGEVGNDDLETERAREAGGGGTEELRRLCAEIVPGRHLESGRIEQCAQLVVSREEAELGCVGPGHGEVDRLDGTRERVPQRETVRRP